MFMKRFLTWIRFGYAVATLTVMVSVAHAQDNPSVRGTVLDKGDRTPLVGVTVAEVDQTGRIVSGAATDLNGNYLLKNVNPQNTVVFSFIGFKTIRESVNNRSVINASLESDFTTLEAVDINAERTTSTGMMEIASRDLTTAATKIEVSELSEIQA